MNLDALFVRYVEEQQPGPSVLTVLKLSWPKFTRYCQAQGIVEMEPAVLENFYKSLLWQPNDKGHWYKANSVHQFMRRVRQVLHWAAQQGYLAKDPTVGLLLPIPLQPVPQRLSWESLQKLLAAPDRSTPMGLRDGLFLHLLTECPLPLSQIAALTLTTVRELVLEPATEQLLQDYLVKGRPAFDHGDGYQALFLGRTGEPLTGQALMVRLNEMTRQVGLGRRIPTRVLGQSYREALQQLQERHPRARKDRP